MKVARLFTYMIPPLMLFGNEIERCELNSDAIGHFVEKVIQYIKDTTGEEISPKDVIILNMITLDY